jgi:hypothetical protein
VRDIVEFVSHPSVASATPDIEARESGVQKYLETQKTLLPFELDNCFYLAIQRVADGKVIGPLTLIPRNHEQGEPGYDLALSFEAADTRQKRQGHWLVTLLPCSNCIVFMQRQAAVIPIPFA